MGPIHFLNLDSLAVDPIFIKNPCGPFPCKGDINPGECTVSMAKSTRTPTLCGVSVEWLDSPLRTNYPRHSTAPRRRLERRGSR